MPIVASRAERDDFDDRNPATYLAPALNHHTDEISCAIGLASLKRLPSTMVSRLAFVSDFVARLYDASDVCRGYRFMPTSSPFYFPVIVDVDAISCSKIEFAEAVRRRGSISTRTISMSFANGPTSSRIWPMISNYDQAEVHIPPLSVALSLCQHTRPNSKLAPTSEDITRSSPASTNRRLVSAVLAT